MSILETLAKARKSNTREEIDGIDDVVFINALKECEVDQVDIDDLLQEDLSDRPMILKHYRWKYEVKI